MSKVDFVEASIRHFDDADWLAGDGREPNAGQLYGFAAECGLKALLVKYGLETDSDGDIVRRSSSGSDQSAFRQHINEPKQQTKLINSALNFSPERKYLEYMAMLSSLGDFSSWTTDHRYWSASSIPPPSELGKWKAASREVQAMLQLAKIEGVLS